MTPVRVPSSRARVSIRLKSRQAPVHVAPRGQELGHDVDRGAQQAGGIAKGRVAAQARVAEELMGGALHLGGILLLGGNEDQHGALALGLEESVPLGVPGRVDPHGLEIGLLHGVRAGHELERHLGHLVVLLERHRLSDAVHRAEIVEHRWHQGPELGPGGSRCEGEQRHEQKGTGRTLEGAGNPGHGVGSMGVHHSAESTDPRRAPCAARCCADDQPIRCRRPGQRKRSRAPTRPTRKMGFDRNEIARRRDSPEEPPQPDHAP